MNTHLVDDVLGLYDFTPSLGENVAITILSGRMPECAGDFGFIEIFSEWVSQVSSHNPSLLRWVLGLSISYTQTWLLLGAALIVQGAVLHLTYWKKRPRPDIGDLALKLCSLTLLRGVSHSLFRRQGPATFILAGFLFFAMTSAHLFAAMILSNTVQQPYFSYKTFKDIANNPSVDVVAWSLQYTPQYLMQLDGEEYHQVARRIRTLETNQLTSLM